ncbi:unnamed protein product [Symbiodinium microadriaticum]|nr:unnamed protein product [Symbiodinium microadriaticum]CAE7527519.1 unnamed protein product [Symbiodinium sp. KB8]
MRPVRPRQPAVARLHKWLRASRQRCLSTQQRSPVARARARRIYRTGLPMRRRKLTRLSRWLTETKQ